MNESQGVIQIEAFCFCSVSVNSETFATVTSLLFIVFSHQTFVTIKPEGIFELMCQNIVRFSLTFITFKSH